MFGAIVGGLVGALAGGQRSTQNSWQENRSSMSMQNINDLNKGRSGLEAAGDTASLDQFNQLLSMVNAGPGASAITDGLNATKTHANFMNNILSGGGVPDASMLSAGNEYAQRVFAPQQTALNQQFDDQKVQASRMAARLGRPGNDPILANKLMQEQTRQQTMLNSQQGAFGAQYADGLLGRQLDLSQSLMNVRNGLATQAFNNRQTLMGLGQQLVNSERNYRMGTANKYSYTNGEQASGGGTAGAISGALAGAGTMLASGLGGTPDMSGVGNWWTRMTMGNAPQISGNTPTRTMMPPR